MKINTMNNYKAPAMKAIILFPEGSYMQLAGGSTTIGTEPGGKASDYELETP